MKYLLISLLIIFPISLSELTHLCKDKEIFLDDTTHLRNQDNVDITLAYNGIGSCSSLTPDEDDDICCYVKLKFKNELYDETFTHKGCSSIPIYSLVDNENNADIGDYVDIIEAVEYSVNSTNVNYNIVYKDFSIDCSSNFLKYAAGLCLLLLFL